MDQLGGLISQDRKDADCDISVFLNVEVTKMLLF